MVMPLRLAVGGRGGEDKKDNSLGVVSLWIPRKLWYVSNNENWKERKRKLMKRRKMLTRYVCMMAVVAGKWPVPWGVGRESLGSAEAI